MSKLDAAINALMVEKIRLTIEPTKGPELKQIDSAIRILEAAGKVDRKDCEIVLDLMEGDCALPEPAYDKELAQLRAMLESIPPNEINGMPGDNEADCAVKNKSLMKLAQELGVSFSAAKIIYDAGREQGEDDEKN